MLTKYLAVTHYRAICENTYTYDWRKIEAKNNDNDGKKAKASERNLDKFNS
jgi:hypothetical protein